MNLRKIIMVVGISAVALLPIIAITLFFTGRGLSLTRKVTEFYVCNGRDDTTGKPTKPIKTFSLTDQESRLFACGLLETDGRPALLTITVREDEGQLVDFSQKDEWEPGYFYYPITFDKNIHQGTYTVYLFSGRILLSQWNFEITK